MAFGLVFFTKLFEIQKSMTSKHRQRAKRPQQNLAGPSGKNLVTFNTALLEQELFQVSLFERAWMWVATSSTPERESRNLRNVANVKLNSKMARNNCGQRTGLRGGTGTSRRLQP
jgi:hypothetical protein